MRPGQGGDMEAIGRDHTLENPADETKGREQPTWLQFLEKGLF